MNAKLCAVMNDWRTLNTELSALSEREVQEMLEWEQAGPRRKVFLLRLHQRYSALRTARERVSL